MSFLRPPFAATFAFVSFCLNTELFAVGVGRDEPRMAVVGAISGIERPFNCVHVRHEELCMIPIVIGVVVGLVVGALIAYLYANSNANARVAEANQIVDSARAQADQITADANEKADTARKTAVLEAKEEIIRLRQESEEEDTED